MEYYKKCGYDIQDGKAIIPEGETEIKDRAFRDCKEITEITLPEWMEEIGEYGFYGCKNLKNIILPR